MLLLLLLLLLLAVVQDFIAMCDLFEKLPETIKTAARATGSRRLCIYIMLARWRNQDRSWTKLARSLNMHRGKMIDLYTTTTLAIYNQADYNALSTKLDVPCIINKITDWAMAVKGLVRVPPLSSGVCVSQQLRLQGGLVEQECIGFADCTTQTSCRPSKQAAAKRKKLSTVDVQKYAYCGGKTGAHGASAISVFCV